MVPLPLWVYTRDANSGWLTAETDPLNRTTSYTLDSKGFPVTVTYADGNKKQYTYSNDAFHAMTKMTDELNNVTTFVYDGGGHLQSVTDGNVIIAFFILGGILATVLEQILKPLPLGPGGDVTVDVDGDGDKNKTCATAHPDEVPCEELGPDYVYMSADAACRAKWPGTKAVHPQPSSVGPCIEEGGIHYRCQAGGKFQGTASCCPCCEDTQKGPVLKTLCRHH